MPPSNKNYEQILLQYLYVHRFCAQQKVITIETAKKFNVLYIGCYLEHFATLIERNILKDSVDVGHHGCTTCNQEVETASGNKPIKWQHS